MHTYGVYTFNGLQFMQTLLLGMSFVQFIQNISVHYPYLTQHGGLFAVYTIPVNNFALALFPLHTVDQSAQPQTLHFRHTSPHIHRQTESFTTMDSSGNKKKNNKKNKNNKKSQPHQIPMITDERFAPAMNDPRFMQAPKKRSKVEIDSRFKQAFTDRNFASSKAPVDKRGKRRSEKDKSKSSLSHYYRLEEDEVKKKVIEEEEDDESEGDSESGSDCEKLKLKTEVEDELESVDEMSDTGTDTDSAFSEEEEAVPEEDVPEIEKETRRLAVVNLDWTEVRVSVLLLFYPLYAILLSV